MVHKVITNNNCQNLCVGVHITVQTILKLIGDYKSLDNPFKFRVEFNVFFDFIVDFEIMKIVPLSCDLSPHLLIFCK